MMRSARRRKGDFKKSWSPGGGILKFWDLTGDKRFVQFDTQRFFSTPWMNEVQSSGILVRNNPLIYFSSLCKGILFFLSGRKLVLLEDCFIMAWTRHL
jgi:hypothetical protein